MYIDFETQRIKMTYTINGRTLNILLWKMKGELYNSQIILYNKDINKDNKYEPIDLVRNMCVLYNQAKYRYNELFADTGTHIRKLFDVKISDKYLIIFETRNKQKYLTFINRDPEYVRLKKLELI